MIIRIDSENPDYYQWGVNCRLLDFTTDMADGVISYLENSNSIIENKPTEIQRKSFYNGYFSEI